MKCAPPTGFAVIVSLASETGRNAGAAGAVGSMAGQIAKLQTIQDKMWLVGSEGALHGHGAR